MCGGFSNFGWGGGVEIDVERLRRAWPKFFALFACGGVSSSFVDHYVGHMPPSNLRPVYVIIGLAMMSIAVLLLLSLRVTGKS